MNERDRESVEHLVEAAHHATSFVSGRRRSLGSDDMLKAAVERQLEILGEAATRVSLATRSQTPEVPWKRIIAFGKILERCEEISVHDLRAALDALPAVSKALETVQNQTS